MTDAPLDSYSLHVDGGRLCFRVQLADGTSWTAERPVSDGGAVIVASRNGTVTFHYRGERVEHPAPGKRVKEGR